MFTTLSFPQSLHLIGKSLTSVVGSSHSTVCLPHAGHRKRLWFDLFSALFNFSANSFHLVLRSSLTKKSKQKSLYHYRLMRYMAQAQRLRRKSIMRNTYIPRPCSGVCIGWLFFWQLFRLLFPFSYIGRTAFMSHRIHWHNLHYVVKLLCAYILIMYYTHLLYYCQFMVCKILDCSCLRFLCKHINRQHKNSCPTDISFFVLSSPCVPRCYLYANGSINKPHYCPPRQSTFPTNHIK